MLVWAAKSKWKAETGTASSSDLVFIRQTMAVNLRIPPPQVTAGLFYGFAGLSVLARGIIRFITRRPLALDDYLLFLAFASLTAATGLIYSLIEGMYLATAVEATPALIFKMTSAQLNLILNEALNQNVFLALAWTTTFLVKFSFLAFFSQLIRNVQSIKYYYWGVVVLTVVSWMFLTSESFILCSDFGINAGESSFTCVLQGA